MGAKGKLRIEGALFNGSSCDIVVDHFWLGDEPNNYKMHFGKVTSRGWNNSRLHDNGLGGNGYKDNELTDNG